MTQKTQCDYVLEFSITLQHIISSWTKDAEKEMLKYGLVGKYAQSQGLNQKFADLSLIPLMI